MKKLPSVMKSQTLKKVADPALKFLAMHDADILTALSISSNAASLGLMYKNAPKIREIIAYYKIELAKAETKEDKKKLYLQALKELNPLVTPILGLTVVSFGCSIASNRRQNKKISALSATVSTSAAMTANALKEYGAFREEAKDILGEKKIEEIDKKVDKKVAKELIAENSEINHKITPLPGDKIYIDKWTGRQYSSNKKKIELAVKVLEGKVHSLSDEDDDPVTLNDWYDLIGLERVELGDDRGWNVKCKNQYFAAYFHSDQEDNGDDIDYVGVVDIWPHPYILTESRYDEY